MPLPSLLLPSLLLLTSSLPPPSLLLLTAALPTAAPPSGGQRGAHLGLSLHPRLPGSAGPGAELCWVRLVRTRDGRRLPRGGTDAPGPENRRGAHLPLLQVGGRCWAGGRARWIEVAKLGQP